MQIAEHTREKLRKPFGLVLILMGLASAYWLLYQPLEVARHTGSLKFYAKALVLPPLILALGGLLLFTNLKDGDLRKKSAKGKPAFTAKGWWFFGITGFLCVLSIACFWWVAHLLGFDILNASPN